MPRGKNFNEHHDFNYRSTPTAERPLGSVFRHPFPLGRKVWAVQCAGGVYASRTKKDADQYAVYAVKVADSSLRHSLTERNFTNAEQ